MTRLLYLLWEEYLVTALVPSETACLASSPGRMSRDGGLDLSGGDGGLLVVCSELGGLSGDTLEDV